MRARQRRKRPSPEPNRSQNSLCLCKAPPNFTIPCSGSIAGGWLPTICRVGRSIGSNVMELAHHYRGHGRSEYDRNPDNYTLPVALADLSAVLIALEIAPAIFLGSSYGGLLAMMLAVWRPTAIAGVILNDIGPVMEPHGWVRIKGYVGKLPIPRNFEEGAEILHWWFDAQFPKLASQDWIALAQRTWREHRGRLVPDYDPKLARTLEGADLQHPLTLWNHFDSRFPPER